MDLKSLNRSYRSSRLQRKRKHSTSSISSSSSSSSLQEKKKGKKLTKGKPVKKRREFRSIDGASSSKSDNESNSRQSTELNILKQKKMQTIDSIQKQMLPSNEEFEYRKKKDEEFSKDENFSKLFTCTKCNFNFQSLINNHQKICVHPLMNVLMCKKCCSYYGDGDFSLDSDNEDKYCRWCGEGGTIFTCSKCICGFCSLCIKRHFGIDALKKVEKEDDWLCYFCEPKPLWHLRFICSLAQKLCEIKKEELKKKQKEAKSTKKKISKKSTFDEDSLESTTIETLTIKTSAAETSEAENKNENSTKKKIASSSKCSEILKSSEKNTKRHSTSKRRSSSSSSSSSNSDSEVIKINTKPQKSKRLKACTPKKNLNKLEGETSFETKRFQIIEKLENILKLTEYQMSFGVHWSTKKLKHFSSNINQLRTESSLKKECQKIKWFISSLASYLVGFSNSIDLVEKQLLDDNETEVLKKPTSENSAYTPILQFLSFITNQVKMFSDREIKFNELMEAEVYEDNYVVGLKVKTPNKSQSSAPNTNIGIVESSTATESLEKHTVDHKHVDEDEVQNRSCNAKSPDSSGKGELSQIRDFVDAVIQQVNGNKSSSEKEKTERDSRDPNMSSENEDYDSVQVNKNGSPCQKKRNQKELNEDSEKQNSNSTQINENDSLSQKEETEKDSLDLTKSSSEGNENAIEKSSFNDDDIQAMITLLNS